MRQEVTMDRRRFLATTGAAVAAAATSVRGAAVPQATPGKARFRTGLVAYSYRQALTAKTMTYEDLIRVAVDTGTDGIDLTVYWFPNTGDDYVLSLRRLAYKNRVEIYSLGTRVRLAQPTADLREAQLVELRKWADVAQKIGASHLRVFGGNKPEGATLDQAISYAAETWKRAAEYAGPRGLVVGVEDDGGITDFAKDTIEIVKRANSPYAGMNLDIGNFRPPKVLEQVEMSIPYAVSTHVKTTMALDEGGRAEYDWDRIFAMFARHGFKGYMGLEYEAPEDPAVAVPRHLRRLKELAQKYSA
jgi:L-ribulose-5-phosphate 3-epimerase